MSDQKKPPKQVVYRDSVSGEFVRKTYAERHPATTEKQHIRKQTTGRGMSRRK